MPTRMDNRYAVSDLSRSVNKVNLLTVLHRLDVHRPVGIDGTDVRLQHVLPFFLLDNVLCLRKGQQ